MLPATASAHLSDDVFLKAVATCELPLSGFRHGDHLRLAWLHLHREPFQQALTNVQREIQRFATFHGAGHIYHETVTRAWVTLLATHAEPTFQSFLAENAPHLNHQLLHRFWTAERLDSAAARGTWLPPDKAPLP